MNTKKFCNSNWNFIFFFWEIQLKLLTWNFANTNIVLTHKNDIIRSNAAHCLPRRSYRHKASFQRLTATNNVPIKPQDKNHQIKQHVPFITNNIINLEISIFVAQKALLLMDRSPTSQVMMSLSFLSCSIL